MGLPLFVAKVESDLPSKSSTKRDVLAPAHAGVQSLRSRSRRINAGDDDLALQEARWHQRLNRERERSMRRRGLATALLPNTIQVIAAPSPPPQTYSDEATAYSSQNDIVDTAMDEFLRLDTYTRQLYADRLQILLGSRWTMDSLRARARILDLRNARANANSLAENNTASGGSRARSTDSLGVWTREPRPQARRARVVSPAAPGDEGLTAGEQSDLRRIIASMQSERSDRRPAAVMRDRRASRTRAARQQRGIDGLGDRQRSLSPEMWDTLLSTMTPDPEPPSVTSSFASFPTTQSHNTSASSFSVPDSGPRPADGFLPEPPCDSGCENSDHEDEGPSNSGPTAEGRPRPDGPSEGPFARHRRPDASRPQGSTAPSERAGNGDLGSNGNGASSGFPRSHYLRLGWVGQLSVGASDEGVPPDQASRETNIQAPPVHNEDDWSGMQLIVRRLARREDIPDEWWLEAGLSRTLGDDAEMQ